MSLPTFAPDRTIRFDYDPVVHKFAFPINHVGAHLPDAIAEAEYAHTDDNTVYVSATSGSDTTGDGTQANPYATLLKSINEASEDRPRVVVLDSTLYSEDLSGADYTYFQGFYAAEGEVPTYDSRVLGFTPADANTIFVAKTGSDITGTGTQAAPVLTIEKAITLCDGTHQRVGIMDSGVYMEKAFTFAANFLMLFALAGCCPEVRIDSVDRVPDYEISEEEFELSSSSAVFNSPRLCKLANNNILAVGVSPNDGGLAYLILGSDGSSINANITPIKDNLDAIIPGEPRSVHLMENGNIFVLYNYSGGGPNCSYIILSGTSLNIERGPIQLKNYSSVVLGSVLLSNGNIFLIVGNGAGSTAYNILNKNDYPRMGKLWSPRMIINILF